jgi:hypothetical protein
MGQKHVLPRRSISAASPQLAESIRVAKGFRVVPILFAKVAK